MEFITSSFNESLNAKPALMGNPIRI